MTTFLIILYLITCYSTLFRKGINKSFSQLKRFRRIGNVYRCFTKE